MHQRTLARQRRSTLLLPALLLVAACGSTVQQAPASFGAGAAQGPVGDLGATGDAGSSELASFGGAGSSGVSGTSADASAAAPEAAGQPVAAGGTVPRAGGGKVSGAQTGVAANTSPVEIGIMTVDLSDGVAAASSAGNCNDSCQSFGSVSQETMANAVVTWVNRRGGLAGRPIKLVTYQAKVSDVLARGSAAVVGEACQRWTHDHKVAALVLQGVTDDIYACGTQNGLPVINNDYANYVPDTEELKGKGKFNYASGNFNLNDTARYYISALADQGFLKPGNKVGLIFKESRVYERVIKNTMIPELKRHGLALDATAAWNEQTQQAHWSQFVLQFKSKQVDRVLIFGGWNFGMANFAKTAETQDYRPRYGVSSISGPNEMKLQGVPPTQLRGAQGVGWWTFADVPYPGDAARFNSAAAQCKEIMVGAGQPWTPTTYLMAMKFCDGFFLLKALADRAGAVSQPAFYAAADGLGTAYTSPYMWRTSFRPGDHNGAMYLRNLAYDEPCDCFEYTGEKYLPPW